MFEKVLVANRATAATRVIRALRSLGVRSVAVYSEADRDLPAVAEADEAFPLGPAPARDSYLNQDRILAIARAAGGDGLHPGYGFLSENPDFARAVEAGATAVMPPADMFWGDRYGRLVDPFGHHWSLAEHIEDPTPEQMKERMAEAMSNSES